MPIHINTAGIRQNDFRRPFLSLDAGAGGFPNFRHASDSVSKDKGLYLYKDQTIKKLLRRCNMSLFEVIG